MHFIRMVLSTFIIWDTICIIFGTFLVSEMNTHAIWNKCSWTRCY